LRIGTRIPIHDAHILGNLQDDLLLVVIEPDTIILGQLLVDVEIGWKVRLQQSQIFYLGKRK